MVINFLETIVNLLVPDKRKPNIIAFLTPIANQLQLLSNITEFIYKIGTDDLQWDVALTYTKNAVVRYGKEVYISTKTNNVGNLPGFSDAWLFVTPNFIGTDQRVYFNGTKLVFEYAINTFFGTVYNPNTTLNSEIYVETVPSLLPTFRVASTEPLSSSVFKDKSSGNIKLTNNEGIQYNLIIWVKDLNTTGKPTSAEIKIFADKYIYAGIKYVIQSY